MLTAFGNKNSGRYLVKKGDKYGVYSASGDILFPVEFEMIGEDKEGRCLVRKNGKYGMYTIGGKEIIPAEFDTIGEIDN